MMSLRKAVSDRLLSVLFLTTTVLTFLLVAGCGGGGAVPMISTTTPTPAPPSSAPPPAPMPTPTPTSGSNPGMYQVQLVSTEHSQVSVGQVTVNAVSDNGDVEIKVNQTVTNTQLSVKFCRFGALNQDCVLV